MPVSGGGPTPEHIREADWSEKRIAPGVVWKRAHIPDLFDSPQSVSVVYADLKTTGVTVVIPYLAKGLKKTSALARATTGALAAVNGNFFDTRKGGSVCFVKVGGRVISETRPSKLDAGAVAIATSGTVTVLQRPPNGWEMCGNYPDILTNGPILVWDGVAREYWGEQSFFTARHPRTAVGVARDRRLILVAVDGRTTPAAGMSCAELATTMAALGCDRAVNLDGGGSTTMWVRGEPFGGVVNFPSDNRRYDHLGERACSNVVVVLGNQ